MQKIAEENQVKSALVYVFYTQKPWSTFTVRSNHQAETWLLFQMSIKSEIGIKGESIIHFTFK